MVMSSTIDEHTVTTRGYVAFEYFPMRLVLTSCSTYEEAKHRCKDSGYPDAQIFLHTLVRERPSGSIISETYERVLPK